MVHSSMASFSHTTCCACNIYTYSSRNSRNIVAWGDDVKFSDNFLKFPITKVLEEPYVNDFIKGVEYFSVVYLIIMCYAIYKTLPKSAYDSIEHGSSDWCAPGEQYKILSKKNGLILAKDNYLPIDKTGNINVLIVGRFWFW